jgi:hypothetical protein
MRLDIKLTGALYDQIMLDLVRPHPFAGERVGFVSARIGSGAGQDKLILLNCYHSIPDDHYVDDPTVGARIGSASMTWAMQDVYHGRRAREGIFHIHVHGHLGETGMSGTDNREIPKLIPGFQSVGSEGAHGIIILSNDHGTGWVWLPGCKETTRANSISVIGVPVKVFRQMGPP